MMAFQPDMKDFLPHPYLPLPPLYQPPPNPATTLSTTCPP